MDSFAHFILTRFNVPLQFDLHPGRQPKHMGIDEGWLGRRFDLFERVCLNSVQRQTEGGFQWLVFMDWATPLPFKERMAALTVRNEFLHPVYCSQFNEEFALEEIRRRERPGGLRLTTRLEVNTAIHPRTVARLQEWVRTCRGFEDSAGQFLRIPLGCVARGGAYYLAYSHASPFTSYVSASACRHTVLDASDGEPGSRPAASIRSWRPLWCQVASAEESGLKCRLWFWPGGGGGFAGIDTEAGRADPG